MTNLITKKLKFSIILGILFLILPLFSYAQELRDAIGIRVMKNPEFLSPATWYLENVPSPGRAKSTQVDGYEAVIDGRSVYVEATRVDEDNDLTEAYIFIMSYNEDGGTAIVNIFTQLLENWNFNSNIDSNDICDKVGVEGDIYCTSDFDCVIEGVDYGPCLSQKGKLRRDIKRVGDLQDLKRELEQYALSNESYPSLAQGTYIPRYSTSKWPSWNETLSRDLGINLPSDPLNRFYNDCNDLDGYHPDTCWNEDIKNFECNSGFIDPTNNLYPYLYIYSAKGICSLHCDDLICIDSGIPTATTCTNNQDCISAGLTGPCGFEYTCTQNSDCPDIATGEYCMKVNGVIDIQFNLETDKDAVISVNYPLDLGGIGATSGAGGICSDSSFWALSPVSFTDIDCCPPPDCVNMGLTGYTCGTYINNCGESIDCGVCGAGESCINGSCCSPDCTGKACGDDGCGGTCGSCDIGFYCDNTYTCQEGCLEDCIAGSVRCNPSNEWTQQCANCDIDSCNEWCDNTDCAVNPSTPYCNDNGTIAICGECKDSDPPQQCGTSNIGECSLGTEACTMGFWGACTGGIFPGVEICDGLDNDCNGVVDNIPSGSLPEFNGGAGVCAGYFQDCINSTLFDPTNLPDDYQNPETLCDGLDNDCDGLTDENQSNLGNACGTGTGECGASGIYVCNPSDPNGPATCSASSPNTPQPETCNGLDDDCDGIIDNNITTLPNIFELSFGTSDSINYDNNSNTNISNDIGGNYLKVSESMPTPYIWIANSPANTVLKIRTNTGCRRDKDSWDCGTIETRGQLIGEFAVGTNPSRTAVNVDNGDVWIANRNSSNVHKLDIDGNIMKVCFTGNAPRGIAIEDNGDVWIGNSGDGTVVKLSGDDSDCTILQTVVTGGLPYGLAIDSNNNVWMSDNGNGTIISYIKMINTTNYTVTSIASTLPIANNIYGITVDPNDNVWVGLRFYGFGKVPAGTTNFITYNKGVDITAVTADSDGNIWGSMYGNNQIIKIDQNGNTLLAAPTTASAPHGICGDSYGQVWSVNRFGGDIRVFNSVGGVIGTYNWPSADHYTYSDMTGLNRALLHRTGKWSQTFDGTNPNEYWGEINWNEIIPSGKQSIEIFLRTSDTAPITSAWTDSNTWNSLDYSSATRHGRYLEVSITMKSSEHGITPVLWGLNITCPSTFSSSTCVPNFGDPCNFNNCGISGGTIECDGICNNPTPADDVLTDCTSAPNNCGATNFVAATCAVPNPVCSAPADIVPLDECNLCSGFSPNGTSCNGTGACDGAGNCVVSAIISGLGCAACPNGFSEVWFNPAGEQIFACDPVPGYDGGHAAKDAVEGSFPMLQPTCYWTCAHAPPGTSCPGAEGDWYWWFYAL